MFTIFVILFIIIEFLYVVNTIGMAENNLKLIQYNKEFKGQKFNQFSEDYKNTMLNSCFRVLVIMIVLFGGLLTDQWLIWISLMGLNIVLVGPLSKLLKKLDLMTGYYVVVWINSIIGLGAGIFHIINDWHLHIDLYKFVENFLK